MKTYISSFFVTILLIGTAIAYTIRQNETKREKIFGGSRARINEAPYHVMLIFNGQYMCGGSLITMQHVLTAAHCVKPKRDYPYASLSVIAGTDSHYTKGAVREAQKVYIHPRYGYYDEWGYDLGIILLMNPFEPSNVISTVALPKALSFVNERVTITGYGRYSSYRYDVSPILKKLSSTILDCSQWIDRNFLSAHDLCVRTVPGQGICSGDSGSPLINDGGEVVGVASRVFDCGDGTPDVYTYVYHFLEYINVIVNKTSQNQSPFVDRNNNNNNNNYNNNNNNWNGDKYWYENENDNQNYGWNNYNENYYWDDNFNSNAYGYWNGYDSWVQNLNEYTNLDPNNGLIANNDNRFGESVNNPTEIINDDQINIDDNSGIKNAGPIDLKRKHFYVKVQ